MGEQKVKTIESGMETPAAAGAVKKRKGKAKAQVKRVKIFIKSTFNNTVLSVSDMNGNILGWGSAGRTGFKGSRKSTPYAAQRTMEDLLERMRVFGISECDVVIRGVGIGRESAVRTLISSGIEVLSIRDKTPVPHGGVRSKKPRRV